MREALVIHPMLSFYAGGEYLCLVVCEALQELGYRVSLASQAFNPLEAERIYGLGKVMQTCSFIPIPQFSPHFPHLTTLQKLAFSRQIWPMFQNADAQIVFSTQSSPFIMSQRMFHFVYNANDMFSYPLDSGPLDQTSLPKGFKKIYFYAIRRSKKFLWNRQSLSRDWFLAVGPRVLRDLRKKGYQNSSLIFPPCRVKFKPRLPKRKQVVQVCRMVPDKRLELYLYIASRLPDHKFYLVGKRDSLSERLYPGYANGVLSNLPRNVIYIEALVRERPELLEESQIYLYTGKERGIGVAIVEAMAAGCLPFAPTEVGAADVLKAAGVGVIYRTADEAVAKLRTSLEWELSGEESMAISDRANKFGADSFKSCVKKIADLKSDSPVLDFWPE